MFVNMKYVFSQPLHHEVGMTQGQFLFWIQFSFLLDLLPNQTNEQSLPYYLSIAVWEEQIDLWLCQEH